MDPCQSKKKKFQCSNGSTKCPTYLSQEMMNDQMWKTEKLQRFLIYMRYEYGGWELAYVENIYKLWKSKSGDLQYLEL